MITNSELDLILTEDLDPSARAADRPEDTAAPLPAPFDPAEPAEPA